MHLNNLQSDLYKCKKRIVYFEKTIRFEVRNLITFNTYLSLGSSSAFFALPFFGSIAKILL